MSAVLGAQQHGKGKVRLGRTWREGSKHYFVEWRVHTMLESDMAHAYYQGSNKDMTATDTQKNTVYYVAKHCSDRCTAEEYAIALGRHFCKNYPKVTKAKILVEQKPWTRVSIGGKEHNHGYAVTGTETRTASVEVDENDNIEVTSGIENMQVLKTTQAGYSGFFKDKYTILKDTEERIVATAITSTWKYSTHKMDFDAAYNAVKTAIMDNFYGPSDKGVFSPSVQFTMFEMAKLVIQRVKEVESIFFNLPNLHFLPCTPVTSKFEDDVYIATSEPHGNIEAVITRGQIQPHCKL